MQSEALNSLVKTCLQSSTIKYDIFALLSTELEVARLDFMDDLKDTLYEKYYVTLVNVSFDDIDGGVEVETILQQKAQAEQKIEVARREAEASLITATNQAEIEKTLADASSYAIKVEGAAKGEAASAYTENIEKMISTLFENMNGVITYNDAAELILQIVFYDTWNGTLPTTLTSDDLSSMIGSLISK